MTTVYEEDKLNGVSSCEFINSRNANSVIEQTYPVFGVAVTLEEIAWHGVDSCALAYGMAARQAMRRIIAPEDGGMNYELAP